MAHERHGVKFVSAVDSCLFLAALNSVIAQVDTLIRLDLNLPATITRVQNTYYQKLSVQTGRHRISTDLTRQLDQPRARGRVELPGLEPR